VPITLSRISNFGVGSENDAEANPTMQGTNSMTAKRQPTFRKPNEGRTIAVVGDIYRFLATGEDTDGRYATWEAIVPPGGGPPPHVHSRTPHVQNESSNMLLKKPAI
jgi:hypothetical protein